MSEEQNLSNDVVVGEAVAAEEVKTPVEAEIPAAIEEEPELKVDNKHIDSAAKTPSKRTPSKRKTFIERAQAESEELIKSFGLSPDAGGRRTRSTRGTPTRNPAVQSETPAKKPRASGGGRGRPNKKLLAAEKEEEAEEKTDEVVEEEEAEKKPEEKKTEEEAEPIAADEPDVAIEKIEEKSEEVVPAVEKKDEKKTEEVDPMEVDEIPEEPVKDDITESEEKSTEEEKKVEDVVPETEVAAVIKENEINSNSEECKSSQPETAPATNNHNSCDSSITPASTTCQLSSTTPDVVQTPQSCN